MGISRTQPMRPALNDVLDAADALRTDLNAETEAREEADTALQQDVDAIKDVIPFSSFSAVNTVKKYIDDLGTNIQSLYRYGKYSATIAANDSDVQTISFSSSFEAGKNVMLLSQIDEENSDLTITISNKTLSGFDISIVNYGTNSITFVFMYFAIGV